MDCFWNPHGTYPTHLAILIASNSLSLKVWIWVPNLHFHQAFLYQMESYPHSHTLIFLYFC